MIDLKEYENLARESGGYSDIEIDMIVDALSAWSEAPGRTPAPVELRDGRILAGFALVRREESSDFTFSVQALCVGPSFGSTRALADLLAKLEEEVGRAAGQAILRIEISEAKAAGFGAGAFERAGYSLIGHIPDFYAQGNDYYMYAKHLLGLAAGSGAGAKGETK